MNLVDALKKFNRKERYWLIQEALGQVELCEDFRNALNKELKQQLKEDIPENAYWAIDYHFDWLIGVATVMDEAKPKRLGVPWDPIKLNKRSNSQKRLVQGNQEDIDLLIAYGNVLILVECKASSAWTKRQLESKIERIDALKSIFKQLGIHTVLVLLSPKDNDEKSFTEFELDIPWLNLSKYNAEVMIFVKTCRCDEKGKISAYEKHYRVVKA